MQSALQLLWMDDETKTAEREERELGRGKKGGGKEGDIGKREMEEVWGGEAGGREGRRKEMEGERGWQKVGEVREKGKWLMIKPTFHFTMHIIGKYMFWKSYHMLSPEKSYRMLSPEKNYHMLSPKKSYWMLSPDVTWKELSHAVTWKELSHVTWKELSHAVTWKVVLRKQVSSVWLPTLCLWSQYFLLGSP